MADFVQNLWTQWALSHLQRGGMQTVPTLGPGARNNLPAELQLREMDRGRMLDKHRGETGLAHILSPALRQADLLQLSSVNRTSPRAVTVGINLEEVETPLQGVVDHLVRILLTWGTGKGASRAVVDGRHGAQITLVANVLNVAALYFGDVGPVVRVSASVAYGDRPGGQSVLTFTEPRVVLDRAVVSAPFRIPAYAVRVAWYSPIDPNLFPAPAATLQFRADAVLGGAIVSMDAPGSGEFVVVPNGADFMRLRNEAEAGEYGLIYEVHL